MMLDFGEAVRRFYGNYANAEGRAQRSAYWWVQLYQIIILIVLLVVILMADGGPELFNGVAGETTPEELSKSWAALWANLGFSGKSAAFCILIFGLVNFLPGIMLSIRRFHDMDRSGWLVLAFFIATRVPPIAVMASLANIIWFVFPGTNGPNKYGSDPIGMDTDIFG